MTLFLMPKCVIICAILLFAVLTRVSPLRLSFEQMNYQMENIMNQNNEYRLIQTSDEYPPAWLSKYDRQGRVSPTGPIPGSRTALKCMRNTRQIMTASK